MIEGLGFVGLGLASGLERHCLKQRPSRMCSGVARPSCAAVESVGTGQTTGQGENTMPSLQATLKIACGGVKIWVTFTFTLIKHILNELLLQGDPKTEASLFHSLSS